MTILELALFLTTSAGLSTTLGLSLALAGREAGRRALSLGLGFAGGVMLAVALTGMLPRAWSAGNPAAWGEAGAFAFGLVLMAVIASLALPGVESSAVRSAQRPLDVRLPAAPRQSARRAHRPYDEPETAPQVMPPFRVDSERARREAERLGRLSLRIVLRSSLRGLPLGWSIYLASWADSRLGIGLAIAAALHILPAGFSLAALFASGGRRGPAYGLAILCGLALPVGCFLGWLSAGLLPLPLSGIGLSGAAGLLAYLAIEEILPGARLASPGREHLVGWILGMAAMVASLVW